MDHFPLQIPSGLLRILGKLNDGKDYSDDDIEAMDWQKKTSLVQKDPVTCSRFFDHRVQQFIKIVLKSDHHPIGKVTDYFYRVEFQQRGSPHIHILIWVEKAPKYKADSDDDVISFINNHVSCSKSNELKELINLQIHKHSKTCRKGGHPICRFGFPLPPFQNTVILEPLDFEIEKYKALYREVQKKINDLHDKENIETMTFDQFLNDVIEMTEEEYIKAIRSNLNGPKVFLKRQPCEVCVNPYMKVILSAWKANHDLQFVLDPYACAMYIVSYINKSQKGMSALLDQATKEARQGHLDLKRQVRHIGNYFTNSVETSAQEAVYLTIQIPLTKATRQVVFINTSPSDQRSFLLKETSTLQKMSPDSTDIEAENNIKRYSNRPRALENWCLADYVSQLDIKYPKKKLGDTANFKDDINEDQCEDVESELESDTETSNGINITLKNGTTIKQRKSFRVIRYVIFNKKKTMLKIFIVNVCCCSILGEMKEKILKAIMKHIKPCTKVFKDLWRAKQDNMNTMWKKYRELRNKQNMTIPILMKLHQAHNKPNLRIWKEGQLILYCIYLLILIVHQNTRPSI